MTKNQL